MKKLTDENGVDVFVSDDGNLFDSEDECVNHERLAEFSDALVARGYKGRQFNVLVESVLAYYDWLSGGVIAAPKERKPRPSKNHDKK